MGNFAANLISISIFVVLSGLLLSAQAAPQSAPFPVSHDGSLKIPLRVIESFSVPDFELSDNAFILRKRYDDYGHMR